MRYRIGEDKYFSLLENYTTNFGETEQEIGEKLQKCLTKHHPLSFNSW